jgi:hypothetical protein
MRTPRNLLRVFTLATAVTVAPAGPSFAADPPQAVQVSTAQNPPPGPASEPYALQIEEGTILRKGVKLPATLGQVVDALREMYPKANLVASPEVTDLMVADLKLRSAELEETLEAVRVASGERFVWRRNGDQPGAIDPTTGLPVPSQPAKGASLYLLTAAPGGPPTKARREVEVFNLRGYIATVNAGQDEKAIEDSLRKVQEIVRDTLERLNQGSAQGLDYQFHSGADLLIVIGPREAIEVARKVVEALPGQPVSVSSRPVPEPEPIGPNAQPTDKQREMFMRRYGLLPQKK